MKKQDTMLSRLLTKLNGPEAYADVEAVRSEFEAYRQSTETQMAEMAQAVETATAAVAAADARVAELEAALAAANATAASVEEQAQAARLAARQEKVVAAVGTERADALMTVTKDMDDAAFSAVLAAIEGKADAEAKSTMFQETGVSATADAAAVEESKEMKILRQRFQSQTA